MLSRVLSVRFKEGFFEHQNAVNPQYSTTQLSRNKFIYMYMRAYECAWTHIYLANRKREAHIHERRLLSPQVKEASISFYSIMPPRVYLNNKRAVCFYIKSEMVSSGYALSVHSLFLVMQ